MNKLVKINDEYFKVDINEFNKKYSKDFSNLDILYDLDQIEKIISIIEELSLIFDKKNILFNNISHGGYIPIKLSKIYDNIYILNTEKNHYDNLLYNLELYRIKNIKKYNNENHIEILVNFNSIDISKIIETKIPLLLTYDDENLYGKYYDYQYKLNETKFKLYLNKNFAQSEFEKNYSKYSFKC